MHLNNLNAPILNVLISILILSSNPDLRWSGITVLILKIGTRRRREVRMTPVALPRGTTGRCPFNSKVGGHQSRPRQNIKNPWSNYLSTSPHSVRYTDYVTKTVITDWTLTKVRSTDVLLNTWMIYLQTLQPSLYKYYAKVPTRVNFVYFSFWVQLWKILRTLISQETPLANKSKKMSYR